MTEKLVRLQVWVTPKQKQRVQSEAKKRTKVEKRKVTESEIVRARLK